MKVIGSVGHPLKHTEFEVVDSETGEVLPPGYKGILKVRGPQLMKGYYKVIYFLKNANLYIYIYIYIYRERERERERERLLLYFGLYKREREILLLYFGLYNWDKGL